jgi:glucose-1-phosphate adenylyltransferase
MPLTKYRSKPAVPLAGKYRLIDIPLSNCLNSHLNRIYVLTQFMSVSLHRHIRGTYRFDNFSGGFVEILAAQQTMAEGTDWYQGTADAVRKNLRYLTQPGIKYVVILSGDQLYRMNFGDMLKTHRESGADITIAAKPVHSSEASSLGIMRTNDSGQVIGFAEKPTNAEVLNSVRTSPSWIDAQGVVSDGRDCLASMGIYVFNAKVLAELLQKTHHRDFGKEVFPTSIGTHKVQLHLFDGYWEDIGTIRSFFEANLQLTRPNAPYELTTPTAPIYTRPRFLPPTRFDGATVESSLVADGCIIEPGTHIVNSVVGLRCKIGRNVTIRDSIIMGADFYETADDIARHGNQPPIGIGAEALIEKAIIDKNCRIGSGAQIVNPGNQGDCEINESCSLRDGILVVEKDACFSANWRV